MSVLRNFAIMIKNVKANLIILHIFLIVCSLGFPMASLQAMPSRITLQDDNQGTCKLTVLKSTGEVQQGVYAKVFGNFEKFEADENGVITVKYTSSSYSRSVSLYFHGESDSNKKTIQLDTEKAEMTVYFDKLSDILEYKRTARLFPIEGMVVDERGNPIERATVSSQGTGRRVFTDEMGLFKLDADFNHSIVIRANGKNNQSFPITHFLHSDQNFNVIMQPKSSWELYSSAEIMPEFPGGMTAFQNYLKKNLEYPEKAKRAKLEGVVVVQFIVDTNGAIIEPRIARHLETSLDSAAWRLVRDMPRWTPASDYGTPVRCKYSLPVAFKIPKPKPVTPIDSIRLISTVHDSLAMDSARMKKALMADSLRADSLHKDSLAKSQLLMAKDSLQQDSTRMMIDKDQPTVKKRNIFVRFFRWLFGIERRQRKRAEKELLLKAQQDSLKADSLALIGMPLDSNKVATQSLKKTLKKLSKADLLMNQDSIKLSVDSLDINVNELKKETEKLKKEKQELKKEKQELKKEKQELKKEKQELKKEAKELKVKA